MLIGAIGRPAALAAASSASGATFVEEKPNQYCDDKKYVDTVCDAIVQPKTPLFPREGPFTTGMYYASEVLRKHTGWVEGQPLQPDIFSYIGPTSSAAFFTFAYTASKARITGDRVYGKVADEGANKHKDADAFQVAIERLLAI